MSSGHSPRGPTGSCSATQLRPCLPYIRNAWREGEKTKLLSPIMASTASLRSCARTIRAAVSRSSAVGGGRRPAPGRSNCQSARANANSDAPPVARRARDAFSSNSNCHHISRL